MSVSSSLAYCYYSVNVICPKVIGLSAASTLLLDEIIKKINFVDNLFGLFGLLESLNIL